MELFDWLAEHAVIATNQSHACAQAHAVPGLTERRPDQALSGRPAT